MTAKIANTEKAPLLQVRNLKRYFDVSRPWLNRVLEGKPRQNLKAVDGIDFEVTRAKASPWWANQAAENPPWQTWWSDCSRPPQERSCSRAWT